MARPIKNNADYFSHDIGMRNDMKIKALRRKYGLIGYASYVMLIEIIAGSDGFEFFIKTDDALAWELLAGDIDIDTIELKSMIEYMTQLGLIIYEDGKIWSNGLKKRLASVQDKRELMRHKRTKASICDAQTTESESLGRTNSVCDAQSTQSKVKERKEKESKVDIYPKGYSESEDSPPPISEDILENKNEGQAPTPGEDQTITLVLEFLKKEIGVADFREDKKSQRAQARNVRDLKQEIGDHELRRRLEALKADRLKLQNCNSISYLYGELKSARIDPIPPTPIAGNAGANTQAIPKMHTPLVNPYLVDIEVERDPEESARVKAELDERVAKLKARGILSNRPNILTPHA